MGTTNISVETGKSIEIDVGQLTINLEVSPQSITIEASSITTANYVAANFLFSLNGSGGTTGFKYNSTTGDIEFYIANVLVGAFNPNVEGDPFA